jgi:hypothetical protein
MKRLAGFAAIAAAFTLGIAGPASAGPILTAEIAPASTSYNSDGTFEGLADVLNQVCAAAGQQEVPDTEGLSAKLCVPHLDSEGNPDGTYELAQLGSPAVGFGSDGFFFSLQNLCLVGQLVGVPIPGQTVEVAPGVSVSICP